MKVIRAGEKDGLRIEIEDAKIAMKEVLSIRPEKQVIVNSVDLSGDDVAGFSTQYFSMDQPNRTPRKAHICVQD